MICLSAAGSALQDSAFGYFITACVVILLAITSYIVLPKMVKLILQNKSIKSSFDLLRELQTKEMCFPLATGVFPVLHGEQ